MVARSTRIERLVHEVAPDLLQYFERRVLPVDDAADLVSETLLIVVRRADALPAGDTEARMWMFGIAKRVLATHRRGAVRRHALADRLREEIVELIHDGDTPERLAEREQLTAALGKLTRKDRELIALVVWDGFSLADVARHLGMREGTVRSRYSRARAALRGLLSSAPGG